MKRVAAYDDLTRIYRITVDVVFECTDSIVATEILPLQKDNKYDELALDYYNDFILDTIALFDSHDFAILEERKSPYSYSEYFVLVKQQDLDNDNYQFVLFIRLSDHDNRKSTRKALRNSIQIKRIHSKLRNLKRNRSGS